MQKTKKKKNGLRQLAMAFSVSHKSVVNNNDIDDGITSQSMCTPFSLDLETIFKMRANTCE